jgi:hypothetical protein
MMLTPPGRAAPGPAASTGAPSATRAETGSYLAEISAAETYKAGAEGTVSVFLSAKGDYHVNGKYPYKFKAADPPPEGLKYPKPVLGRAEGAFEEKRATFKVPFTAKKSGKVSVGGTLHLSVCSETSCIVDKVLLETVVDVK